VIPPGLFSPAGTIAREAGEAARGFLWRGVPAAAEGLIGLVGAGFVIFAGYAALRPVTGPALAALVTGVVLIVLAMLLARLSGYFDPARKAKADPSPPVAQPPDPAVRPRPEDAATMAAFTAAFVLGRWLADHRRP
jgi:hypothetical protein